MPSTSMNLSHPKSGNGLLLRWRTCTASSTSMSPPSPAGAPPIHISYAWMIARSSTSARSINLVNNLPSAFHQTAPQPSHRHTLVISPHVCVSITCPSTIYGTAGMWRYDSCPGTARSNRGTLPSGYRLRESMPGERSTCGVVWRGRGEGGAAPGRALALHRLPYAELKTARGFGIVPVCRCAQAPCRVCPSKGQRSRSRVTGRHV
jgi:hypothetical protein